MSTSEDGRFIKYCCRAELSCDRWEIKHHELISGVGISPYNELGCTQEQADEMARDIFLSDDRIKPDEPYYEVVGQIRLVMPPKDISQ